MTAHRYEDVIAANVREIRRQRFSTQEAFAAELSRISGRDWKRTAVAEVETGQRIYGASDLVFLARALDVLPAALLVIPEQIDGEDVDAVIVGQVRARAAAGESPRIAREGVEMARDDVQRLGARVDADHPAEYVREVARGLTMWRERAQEAEGALEAAKESLLVAFNSLNDQRLKFAGIDDGAEDLQQLALKAVRNMKRYEQGPRTQVHETPED